MKKSSAVYLGLGSEFVGLVAVFLFLGNWADERLDLKGFGLIGGLFLALILWAAHFIWVVRSTSSAALDKNRE